MVPTQLFECFDLLIEQGSSSQEIGDREDEQLPVRTLFYLLIDTEV